MTPRPSDARGLHRRRPGRRPPGHAAAHRARAPPGAAPAGERARGPGRGHRSHRSRGRRRPRGLRRPPGGPGARCRPGRRRGAGRRAGPAHVPVDRARLRGRRQPPRGRAAAAHVQLLVPVHLRGLPAPVRLLLRLPDPGAGPAGGARSPSAPPPTRRSRRSPASAASASPAASRRPPARTWSATSRRTGSPTAFGDRTTEAAFERRVGRLLDNFWDGEVSSLGEAIARGAGLRPGPRAGRRHPARAHLRRHRPDRPAARRRHRGHRLQDRQDQQPEGRGREPPADHLRPGLPRRAGPGHARARDPLLHRERDPAVHGPHGRAAGSRPARSSWPACCPIRAGEFTANPGRPCEWCDYRAMCPERA